jgi:signal transduction histidine kinase
LDTKSTNSKAYIFTKVVAVLLVVLVLGFSAVQAVSAYITYEDNATGYYRLRDAVKTKGGSNKVYTSGTFRSNMMSDYLSQLGVLTYQYGNGTMASFEKTRKDIDLKAAKEKLLYNIYYATVIDVNGEGIEKLLTLQEAGVVSSVKLVKAYEDDEYGMTFADFYGNYSAEGIVSDFCTNTYYGTSWTFSQEKEAVVSGAKKYDADILIDISPCEINYGNYQETMYAGSYAITVDDEKLKEYLEGGNDSEFVSYKQYKKAYEAGKADFESRYKNIYYIYKDNNGRIFSNIEVPDRIYIKDYEYILAGNSSSLIDAYGNDFSYNIYENDNDFSLAVGNYYGGTFNEYLVGARVEGTTMYTTEYETTLTSEESGSGEVHTTMYKHENDGTSIAVSSLENDSFCIFFNENAEFGGRTIYEIKREADFAYRFISELAIYTVLSVLSLGLALVVLIILSGRKYKGDTEVSLPFSDKMFIEIKTVLNCGLIVGIFLGALFLIGEMVGEGMDVFAYMVAGVSLPAIGLLLMDYILYIARHLKAQRFVKSFFVVWFIKVLCVNVFKWLKKFFKIAGKAIKKAFAIIILPLKKLKEALNSEKLFYAKSVEQTVKIKTAILLAINIPFAFVCFLYMFPFEGIDNWGDVFVIALFAIPTIACDALALIRGLSFVGGVSRIAEVIGEYRKGNLDTPINRAGLPSYLVPVGENLEGLGEGIKLAVDEAVKQEATKTELITNISHDLKTPLTSIINYVDLLKKCDIDDETARSYLEVLGEKSDRLKVLITDLVEASKAATGNVEVNLAKISLREILNQLVGEFSDSFEKSKFDVILSVPDSDITVSADNKLLYRVLENLAVNIEKYSMEGTRVYISAESDGTKGVITFKNISKAPLNITPDELKQRFVRGDASRTTDGNGLGLSIAENLCIVQGGSLDINIVGDLFIAKVELNCR